MNAFELVKSRVDICEAAKYYGIGLNRNNKAICIFHKEKTASLSFSKNKQFFKCFACGAAGDVISLVQMLFSLTPHGALTKLNDNFKLGIDLGHKPDRKKVIKLRQDMELKRQFEKWVKSSMDTLILYFRELHFASLDPNDALFYEALQNIDKIEYYIQCIEENPLAFYKANYKAVREIERRRHKRSRIHAV